MTRTRSRRPAAASGRVRRRVTRVDRALLRAATARRSPVTDRVLTALSRAANRSMLWAGIAGLLASTGRRDDRTAAASGLLGIGIAATLVNGPLKFAWRRDRPPITDVAPLLPLPRTFSFPSGHSASAAAFATGVSVARPAAGAVVVPLAAAVAYSRVHTGVHYPSDVLVGAGVGTVSGLGAARAVRAARERSAHRLDSPVLDAQVPSSGVLLTAAQSGDAQQLDEARRVLADGGFAVEREIDVADLDELARLVRAQGTRLVVAAGGDGTVGAAAGVVAGTDVALAVLPLGTSNDVARSIGLPPDPVAAAHVLLAGELRLADAARVRTGDGATRVFLHAATTGVNVAFAEIATNHSVRDRFGGLTYPVAAASALRRYEPFAATIEIDGERLRREIVHLSVGNAPVFGGPLGMRVPHASMTDGLLDVIVVERLTVTRLAIAIGDSLVGQHRPVRRVTARRARAVRVTTDGDHRIAVDGEVCGSAPFEFDVLPASVRIVVAHRPRHPES